jgi:hypothetical protein
MSERNERGAQSRVPRRSHDHGVTRQPDDPYHRTAKPSEPSRCPTCHAVFADGRWTWGEAPDDAHDELCPACRRIQDRFPAGYVTIKGEFFAEHRDEIVNLIMAREKREKAERPLQRIMAIDDKRDGIAEALHDAYKGDLKLRYSRDENLLRASWKR